MAPEAVGSSPITHPIMQVTASDVESGFLFDNGFKIHQCAPFRHLTFSLNSIRKMTAVKGDELMLIDLGPPLV